MFLSGRVREQGLRGSFGERLCPDQIQVFPPEGNKLVDIDPVANLK